MNNIQNLKTRSEILRIIRQFFYEKKFHEVQTPININAPANEMFINAPELKNNTFLRTSPELQMKQLLSMGMDRIFQIGPCFRENEQSNKHSPEFTMLEWYRNNADYMDILADTKELIREIAIQLKGSTTIEYDENIIDLNNWITIPVDRAFQKLANWTPSENFDQNRFDLDLINKVEPELPATSPVILKDYPAPAAALSKLKKSNNKIAERWELYISKLEIANAYSELTDKEQQIKRFNETAKKRAKIGDKPYPIDQNFINSMNNLPECGGIALGIDRLIMIFTNSKVINNCQFCHVVKNENNSLV